MGYPRPNPKNPGIAKHMPRYSNVPSSAVRAAMILARFLSLLLLLTSGTAARGAVLADQPYRLDEYNRLTTDVSINGKGPFRFTLNTGTSMSFLYAGTRDKLGLSGAVGGADFNIYGVSKVVKATPLTLDEVKLSGLTVRQMRVGVLPVSSDDLDGILGLDATNGYALVLDRDQMRLKLVSSGDGEQPPWRDWSSVDIKPNIVQTVGSTFWCTHASFNGQNFTALLDLGAGITIINWAAAEQLGIQRRPFNSMGPPDKRLRDVLGTTAPAVNTFVTVAIGNQYFPRQRVLVADAQVFDIAGLRNVPAALIGTGLLRDHSIAVDFSGRKLYIGMEANLKSALR